MSETTVTRAKSKRNPSGLRIERQFTTAGVHPYDEVVWERRNVEQKNWKTNEIIFEQLGVEFPASWSINASTIVTTKYFRGALGTPARESSLRQVLDRVVNTYVKTAKTNGYFATVADADVFGEEITWMLLHQFFSFNSPVWFNVGTASKQQASACFILSVDDSIDSIMNWYREEGFIFKGGSGAGVNLSKIRSSKELLSSGGTASGPVSFMRGADASAGTIKSGGATRRAAKMVVLDVDHPDIVEFVGTKAREEDKIRALRDAGFDMDLGGKDIISVQYQNANNSVRVSDKFMRAVEAGAEFGLTARGTGEVIETVDAADLFTKIAEATWACADPGMQYDDTINDWHTNPESGRINGSNPCAEFMSLDNSSCNLASLNLMKFLRGDNTFDVTGFVKAVELIITAMEISICFAEFPTERIANNTRDFRQLGIGYANLGALLMATGHGYDSADGRAIAAAITSLMTGVSYRRSAEIAAIVGPYAGYAANTDAHKRVMRKHGAAANDLLAKVRGGAKDFVAPGVIAKNGEAAGIAEVAAGEWQSGYRIGETNGWRNAQASVLAPTGTISFMMDCDTTGIEPDFSLVKFKKLVGGGSMQIVNQQVPRSLAALGYNPETITGIVDHITEHGNVVDAPGLNPAEYAVFDCAASQGRSIPAMGHMHMMAAVQPFLSGAISKTVNLPETATVAEIADIYMQSWKLGLKATAIYRDQCKVGQPLSDAKATTVDQASPASAGEVQIVEVVKIVEKIVKAPLRERLPRERKARTISFSVGGAEGYMTTGEYDDGRMGEVFLKMSKQGSTLAGMMDAFSVSISVGLQYGVPLETFVSKYTNQRFEPSGVTDDKDIRLAQSILDYLFRRLALDYLDYDARSAYGIFTTTERTAMLDGHDPRDMGEPAPAQDEIAHEPDADVARPPAPVVAVPPVVEVVVVAPKPVDVELMKAREKAVQADAPECSTCSTNSFMVRAGSCFCCSACGSSSGCS